jgi:ribosomal-protein-serine acetyltransferase
MTPLGQPVREELSDGRVRIRRYRRDDVDALFEAASESIAEVGPWLPWCHPDYSRKESEEWAGSRDAAWENGSDYSYVIEDARTGQFVGGCGLNQIDSVHRLANLGYWVRSSRTGEGFASAATRLLALIGLEDLCLSRIEIIASVANVASQRVAEKAGAMREGVLRNRLLLHTKPHDAVMYSFTLDDLPQLRQASTG